MPQPHNHPLATKKFLPWGLKAQPYCFSLVLAVHNSLAGGGGGLLVEGVVLQGSVVKLVQRWVGCNVLAENVLLEVPRELVLVVGKVLAITNAEDGIEFLESEILPLNQYFSCLRT